jgi:hypothetical protein
MGFQPTHRKIRFGRHARSWLLGLCVWSLLISTAPARPILDASDPLCFFTTVADQMLRSSTAQWSTQNYPAYTNTFGAETTSPFSITNIPVLIGGQFVYSPAVNRLLQLAANLYDATTNSPYPSVFRPLFTATSAGDLYITGYTNVPSVTGATDLVFSTPFDPAIVAAAGGTNVPVNVYGVPWIIGAKKGLPNFNEFAMENTLAVTRRLQVTRPAINPPNGVNLSTFNTNQMYLMSLNTSIGVELWNSYVSNYSGTILVGVNETALLAITDDDRNVQNPLFMQIFTTNFISAPVISWPGSGAGLASGSPNTSSFKVANFTGPTLTNSVYRSSYANGEEVPTGLTAPCLIPTNYFFGYLGTPALFETNSPNGFYFPQFGVLLTNRLQVFMLDFNSNGVYHVIDYVSFGGPNGGFNVNASLADADTGFPATYGVWNTNYPSGSFAPAGVTYGVLSQILTSKNGSVPAEDGTWTSDPDAIELGNNVAQQAASFSAFFSPGNKFGKTTNLLLSVQAPYAPTRYIVQYLTWQANDPLVHYLASDIDSTVSPNTVRIPQIGVNHYNPGEVVMPLTGLNLGRLNDNYMPWGGNPNYHPFAGEQTFAATNEYNLEIKDPLLWQPDFWDFPTAPYTTLNWIGRVHRGTPWQTIYLKADDVTANGNYVPWQDWTGNGNVFDATNSAPVQDWYLASLLTGLLNPTPVGQMVSVNNTNTNVWLGLLNGLTAWTNSAGTSGSVVISSDSPQAAAIANAIQSTLLGVPGQSFNYVGGILATEQLTEQSPFLNGLDPLAQISDEAYEIIPSQLLSLLCVGSAGAVVQTNGGWVVQFSGSDGYAYALQSSANLVNWITIGTNYPVQGSFSVQIYPASGSQNQFYRSVLLP